MSIVFFIKGDIEQDIRRIEEIISTDVLSPNKSRHPLAKSAFIEILICLRDLMAKSDNYSSRISFKDDVVLTSQIKDVTDLITFVRDALCHPDSFKHFIPNTTIKATYNIAYGKANLLSIGALTLSSDYEDDICFFFGEQKIYLKRHILRAFNEAKQRLLPLISP